MTRDASILRRIRRRWQALFDRPAAEADLDDELRFHLEMETEHQMRMGLPPEAARRRALREFGGVERYRDESRDARGVRAIEDFVRDVRHSSRALRRAPGFALVSIFTVALGVGATTAVFSLVDGILLRPLPYPEPDRLIRVFERSESNTPVNFPAANFHDLSARARSARLAYFAGTSTTVLSLDQPMRAGSANVSTRFFDVMGVAPAHGRGFLAEDIGSMPVAVISDRFWRTAMNARPDWATTLLRSDLGEARIVGIMPRGFSYPAGTDIWLAHDDRSPSRNSHNWSVIGRLAAGSSLGQATAELDQIMAAMKAEHGAIMSSRGAEVRSLHELLSSRVRTLCLVLLGAVVMVLLVACTNLASANLARGEAQQREIMVRASLGAGRGRLVRQLATEKLVLSIIGGLLGIALAWALVRVTVALGDGTIPAFATVSLDARVMAFGLAMAVLTGLLTGLIPAMRVTSGLRGIAGTGAGSGRRSIIRRPLIAVEIALATVLLIGAGLFLRSFRTLVDEDPGYDVEQVVIGSVTLPSSGYRNRNGGFGDTLALTRFYDEALARLRATPEASAVGLVNQIPLGATNFTTGFDIEGGPPQGGSADYRVVDSAYFTTMGIRMLVGRGFRSSDRPGSAHVTVINRAAAERYWPGANPIGRRIRPPGMDLHRHEWLTIVGVVENIRQYALDGPVSPQLYVHYLQRPERLQYASLVVRTSRPEVVVPAITRISREIERNALVEVTPFERLADQSVAARRFSMTLLTAFSILALFLAAVGIYGVMAYLVEQRRREIGVRMALGATRAGVGRLIFGDAMSAVVPGLAAGIIVALVSSRFVAGMLYGIEPVDLPTFLVTPAVILAVALAASVWPAARASRVDPMVAIRAD